MQCPLCKTPFIKLSYKGVELDLCTNCSALWFDKDELRKTKDEHDEFLRWIDPDIWRDTIHFRISPSKKLCPRDAVPLYETTYDATGVRIDVCSICEGILLEKGEFDRIIDELRKQISSESIRGYLKDIGQETLEVFTAGKGFSEEIGDLLIVLKLLSYRILAQYPFLQELIRQLPK